MSGESYDVVVIGAGPAGSYAAYKLASQGHKVAVLEQKEAPGKDICCTGIISPECFDSFGVNSDVILARANSARFFSPSGKSLRLASEKVQAYIVNRASFDQAIAAKAKAQGANYLFSSRVTDIAINRDGSQIEALCHGSRETFTARAVIVASGFNPKLSQRLGLGRIADFAIGAQAEVETKGVDEVEVYLSQQIAPGFFAWLVPTSENRALAGLISPSHAKLYLEKLLAGSFCQGKVISRESEIRQKAIPMGILPRTYRDRVLVIGDAAGQVKPTTGGGIYFGHLGTQIATEVLYQALARDDLGSSRLSHYEKRWKAKISKEILLGSWARQVYARLSDQRIEQIFHRVDSEGIAESLLQSADFSFDWHGKLILAVMKHGLVHQFRKVLPFPRERAES